MHFRISICICSACFLAILAQVTRQSTYCQTALRTQMAKLEEGVAAVRRPTVSAARGAALAVHSAAGICLAADAEAARLLRVSKGLARSTVARLEFLARSASRAVMELARSLPRACIRCLRIA